MEEGRGNEGVVQKTVLELPVRELPRPLVYRGPQPPAQGASPPPQIPLRRPERPPVAGPPRHDAALARAG